MSFTALYSGSCEDCGEELKGTTVTYVGDALVHVRCPKKKSICPNCHLQEPCECD